MRLQARATCGRPWATMRSTLRGAIRDVLLQRGRRAGPSRGAARARGVGTTRSGGRSGFAPGRRKVGVLGCGACQTLRATRALTGARGGRQLPQLPPPRRAPASLPPLRLRRRGTPCARALDACAARQGTVDTCSPTRKRRRRASRTLRSPPPRQAWPSGERGCCGRRGRTGACATGSRRKRRLHRVDNRAVCKCSACVVCLALTVSSLQ